MGLQIKNFVGSPYGPFSFFNDLGWMRERASGDSAAWCWWPGCQRAAGSSRCARRLIGSVWEKALKRSEDGRVRWECSPAAPGTACVRTTCGERHRCCWVPAEEKAWCTRQRSCHRWWTLGGNRWTVSAEMACGVGQVEESACKCDTHLKDRKTIIELESAYIYIMKNNYSLFALSRPHSSR